MEFYKMHGCGNDFCVIDYQAGVDYSNLAKTLCDRRLGIGSDGLIIVKAKPLEMIFYNQDGTQASMCGNGIRCFSRYAYEKGLIKKMSFDVITLAGVMKVKITNTEPFKCSVNIGKPLYNNRMIHVGDLMDSFGRLVTIDGYNLTLYSFFMGTIHTVLFVESLDSEVLDLAPKICEHSLFKAKTNVNFVRIIDSKTIEVRTYERGVGWTLACGTGAGASVVTTNKLGLTDSSVNVKLLLGTLKIDVDKHENVTMEGPATVSFVGHTEEVVGC